MDWLQRLNAKYVSFQQGTAVAENQINFPINVVDGYNNGDINKPNYR